MMLGNRVQESTRELSPYTLSCKRLRPWLLVVLLVSALGLFAQDGTEKPDGTTPSQGSCLDVRVISPSGGGGANDPEGQRPFSVSRVIDLHIKIYLRADFQGAELVTLRVFTPQGHLYQEMAVPFSTDPSRTGIKRSVEGYPRPLDVRPVETERSTSAGVLTVPFPVGGTMISARSIVGRWRVEALFGESRIACGDAVTFTMIP